MREIRVCTAQAVARSLKALLIALLASLAVPLRAAPAESGRWPAEAPGAELEIGLLTVGPGRIYWQRFGHNAIWVRDRARGTETLYHYGLFDFAEDDFLLNFVRGRMHYLMAASAPAAELAAYRAEQRELTLQILNLAPAQRLALRDFLEWNRQPEHARYRYDYFTSNCSTKVRDALDQALGGALREATAQRSRGYTLRMHARRLAAPDLPLALAIHAGLGPRTDRPVSFWDEMFVPMELMRHLREVRVSDGEGRTVPLVAAEQRLAQAGFPEPGERPPSWLGAMLAAGLALAGAIHGGLRARRALPRQVAAAVLALAWLAAGLGGLVLLALMLATEHGATWHNRNVLLFSPLCLALLPAAVGLARGRPILPGSSAVLGWLIVAGALLAWLWLVLPGPQQAMLDWIALWLPVHVVAAFALARSAKAARDR